MDDWMYAPAGGTGTTPRDGSGSLSVFRGAQATDDGKATSSQPRVRRRNRVIASCLECRRRKLKCDKLAPCTNCTRYKRDCLYLAPGTDPNSQQKLADLKEKMGALERSLEAQAADQHAKARKRNEDVKPSSTEAAQMHVTDRGDDDDDGAGDDDDVLEPTPLTSLDTAYEENADDELIDLGVQMGRMRITERIGGFIRPKIVEELNDSLEEVRETHPPARNADGSASRADASHARLMASPKSYIGPGPDYIAPTTSFFFPGTNMNTSLIDYLPSKVAADQLVAQYFHAVHPIARAVHRPTFESQYTLFWGQIATGTEPVPSQQAIVFAVIFSAAVSMSEEQVGRQFGTTRANLVDSLRTGTEMTLSRANFLRTTKVGTMQAFVIYLIPLVRAEVSRAHSALVGTAIRLAECMGLHRDGTYYSMTPVETHIRRMVWHQLCYLDMRTCDATGPRPQIRPDDYDTKLPLNVNDVDLLRSPPPTEDKPYWTDMSLFRIRAEIFQLRRTIWFDMVQIDKRKKSLTSAVVKIQKTRSRMCDFYLPMIDENVPAQLAGKFILHSGSNAGFIQVLHRYLFSTAQPMPDRLRQLLIEAGVANLENSIEFETKPELSRFWWYKGALNQYHAALLLMAEVYAFPMRKDAARIWKCLDFIFEIPPHLSPKQKAELVLTDLRDRMEIYHQMRKVKNTAAMEAQVHQLMRAWERDDSNSPPSLPPLTEAPHELQGQYPVQSQPIDAMLPPTGWSTPNTTQTSDTSGSHPESGGAPGSADIQMSAMEDIDWVEWNKYFPVDINTGDLDLPDFNLADFTGDLSAPPPPLSMPATTYGGVPGAANVSASDNYADVNFTPTYFAANNTKPSGAYTR